jgi:hypothetical protein
MIEIVPKDSSESAQWMAKHKTVVDRVAQRKVIYSTSIRDQVINSSTTEVYARGAGIFAQALNGTLKQLGAGSRNTAEADHINIIKNSVPGLAEHGDTDTSIAAPRTGPPSYTSCVDDRTSGGNVPEVVVTNPSESDSRECLLYLTESGSREREKLQRRLDTLRSRGQNPGEVLQELMDSLRRTGPDPGHLAPPITRRRSTRITSNSSRRDDLLTNPNITPLGNIDPSGMHNLQGDKNSQTLHPEGNRRRTRFDNNANTRNITASDTATLVRQSYFVAETPTPARQNAPQTFLTSLITETGAWLVWTIFTRDALIHLLIYKITLTNLHRKRLMEDTEIVHHGHQWELLRQLQVR